VEANRGVALILVLLVLSFLTVLGSALLTTSTIDVWISDNYKTATQSVYLAEAGVEDAREFLRVSGRTPTQLLNDSAGLDRQLTTGDDEPLLSSRKLVDSFGQSAGNYEVWLRNDNGDGPAILTDSNEVLSLVSVGQIGSTRKTMEVTVQRGKFPETDSDMRLSSVAGLEGLAASITSNATDSYTAATMGSFGAPEDYRVGVVDGNLDLGPGTGYGLLLVRGELTIVGDITWNGLILVIGQGVLRWNTGVTGNVNGGLFVARTRAPDRTLLLTPIDVMYNITDASQIKAANQRFPFNPIAINER
jgi:type IV pilus assembly PilX-like protein